MMEDEANSSWIRRTKYSHTVCHRLDHSFTPLTIDRGLNSRLKSRPQNSFSDAKPVHRSISPVPRSKLSDTFKEARSESKRFSTPHPRRVLSDKGIMGRIFHKDFHENNKHELKKSNTIPLEDLGSMKVNERTKWSKYFDSGRVTSVETGDEFMVDLSKLFIGLRFAHGAYSQIYHGTYKDEAVAVKIIRVPDDDDNGVLGAKLEKQFTTEVTLLSRLHNPNVIKFIAACRKPLVFCVITEYLSEGSLRSYLHKLEHDHNSLPLMKLLSIALDIARGMEYIHSRGIIHRDLKPENVLINEDFHMKVADFGIACEEARCDVLADDPGTYRWMAPEMIKRKSYNRKVDMYSFGLILGEMVTGKIPYGEMNPIQAAFAVVNKNTRPPIPDDCPPLFKALIEQCWSIKPDKRPEFWQVVKVLEQFESSLARDGNMTLVQNATCHDHKKSLRHWIHKLVPAAHNSTSTKPVQGFRVMASPKPKFS